jgi:biotin-dependent carboxylase-like uncharacterized protein
MDTFEVIQPGPLTTIQDLGRQGYQQYGVPPSGAMDNYAFRTGNLLVGNAESAAVLEITLAGCKLRVLKETVVAVTGADLAAGLNGNPLPRWQSVTVHNGDLISFPRLNSGCRAYLAISGGLDIPMVMASAATYIRAGIGGLEGRPLRQGDILRTRSSSQTRKKTYVPAEYIPIYDGQIELRVMLGPQDDFFTKDGIETFLESDYSVTAQADRMGYRLEGPPVQHRKRADIISDGIPLGSVQVPGDGLPITLLADRQTTGGYTKIATVISADISLLAQTRPGSKVKFRQVSEDEAGTALRKYEQRIDEIKRLIQLAGKKKAA